MDKVIVEFINIFVMTPSFFLILIIVAIYGSDIRYVMIVIGLTSWPSNARLMRAQAISLRQRTFIKSAQAIGVSRLSIMFKHIIPNGIFPIIANTTMPDFQGSYPDGGWPVLFGSGRSQYRQLGPDDQRRQDLPDQGSLDICHSRHLCGHHRSAPSSSLVKA